MKVLRIVEFANGAPCQIAGQYLEAMDFDAHSGLGECAFTDDINKAKLFNDLAEAMSFLTTQSRVLPLRADGEPNRPLTCATFEILDVKLVLEIFDVNLVH